MFCQSHKHVEHLLCLYGKNALSFQTLSPTFAHWFADNNSCVSFVDTGKAWVAAGAPLCDDDRLASVALAFQAAAKAQGKRAGWFAVEDRFHARWPGRSVKIGEQPVWNPQTWEARTSTNRSLRRQLQRARTKGVVVQKLDTTTLIARSSPWRESLAALEKDWLALRRMRPLGFLATPGTQIENSNRRVYVATVDGLLVAALHAVPVFGRNGWLMAMMPRRAHAPNGTIEALIDAAMKDFAANGHTFATAGLTPLSGTAGIVWRTLRTLTKAFYNFHGLRNFRVRLQPDAWEPVYLSYAGSGPVSQARAMWDVLNAFAGGRIWSYALRSVLHRIRLA